ncbi:MAG TPA: hypothetical protein PK339_14185 [Flavitalea sp.]|nr:hypothetical protein [Flavitalea sp.]
MFTDFSVVNKALLDAGYSPVGFQRKEWVREGPHANEQSDPSTVKMGQAWKGPAVVLIVPFKKTYR